MKLKLSKAKLSLAALAASVVSASAVPIDMSGLTTGVTEQVQEGFTSAVPIMALVIGITVALRMIRRVAR